MFASTTKSQLNLTNQRADESNPTLTYPDISFAVEDFEEAFESLVSLQQVACCVTVTDSSEYQGVHCAALSVFHCVLLVLLHVAGWYHDCCCIRPATCCVDAWECWWYLLSKQYISMTEVI